MGGDLGIPAIIDGTRRALGEWNDFSALLVGNEELVRAEIAKVGWQPDDRVTYRHTSETLDMDDTLVDVRKKRDSSVSGAVNAVRKKDADIALAIGNTLAAVAVSTFTYGRMKGVKQPGIIVHMPSKNAIGTCMMLDMGANVNPLPEHLYMYAAMADTYARLVYGLDKPRIGVLSVGEEDSKGSVMTKRVFELLREGELNFIGNVEGGDFIKGNVDIVVTDGFTGNAVLKGVESTAMTLLDTIKEGVESSLGIKFGALLMKPVFKKIRKMLDWRENAGGLLLGVKGMTVISHGRADGYAIYKSLETARKLVRVDLLTSMQKAVDIAAAALTKAGAGDETAPSAAADSATDVK